MLHQQHMFSHQQHDPFAFQGHHGHPQHLQQAQQQQAQQQQQQHANLQQYNRLAAVGASNPGAASNNNMPVVPGGEHRAGIAAGEGQGMSEDDRKTMEYITQLLNASTRETALLELSKKREAVPELALVLWHSFGTVLRPGGRYT
jgi:CCR4-NOT transcription complex subunit 9